MTLSTKILNKKVLLLGSCGVLGKAHVKALLEEGAQLIIADRPGSEVLDLSRALGIPGYEINVSDEGSVKENLSIIATKFEGLDGAIFNAAITSEGLKDHGDPFLPFEEYPLALWQKAIDVNLTGAFLFARECGRILRNSGGGSLINIASLYGVVGPDHRIYDGQPFASFPAYSASKAGIIGLTRWLATWYAKYSVRINCVSPGGVFNNHNDKFVEAYSTRTPMGRMASNEEITGILIYLLSDSSQYCTGQNFIIDGGFSSW